MTLHQIRCLTAAHSGGYTSSQISHCCSPKWLSFISGIPVLLTGWFCTISGESLPLTKCISILSHFSLLLTKVASCHLHCSTAANMSGFTLTQMYQYLSLGWFGIVCDVPLILTGVVLCHSWCPKATTWSGSVLFMMFHCHSLRCFALFLDFNCHSLGWLSIITGILVPLTGVDSCHKVFHFCSLGVCIVSSFPQRII